MVLEIAAEGKVGFWTLSLTANSYISFPVWNKNIYCNDV